MVKLTLKKIGFKPKEYVKHHIDAAKKFFTEYYGS